MNKKESIKEETFNKTLKEINTDFGEGSVMRFSDKQKDNYQYISTDSIAFNRAIGGGVVLGKMYEIMGWEGSGKSTVCGHLAKNAQLSFPERKVVYVDSENSLDLEYFQNIGVDIDNLYIVQIENAEQGFTIAQKLINTGEVSLCIIDSDTAMQPKGLIEGEFGEMKMGLKARLNGQVYPQLHKSINNNNTALIVVSQYREKIGVIYGSPTTTSGGHCVKFTADCRLEISKSLAKDGDDIYGTTITVKAIKNRLAVPFKKATFEVVFGKGINIMKDLINVAISDGVIIKGGAGWLTYNELKIQGVVNFETLLNDNPELEQELKEKILTYNK